jgi:hypothetical protein
MSNTTASKRPRSLSSDEDVPQSESTRTVAKRLRGRFYQYTPLKNPESELRILKLLPSNEPDEIYCSLQTFSLDEKPFYIAASYEWGEPEPQVDIKIDGKYFRIRHILWLFLLYLQNTKPDLVESDHFRIWVDAICIDQSHLIEKNAQVQIMSRIFTQEDSVFSWLGWMASLDTKTIFRFVKEATFHGQQSLLKPDDEIRRWHDKFVHSDTGQSLFGDVPLVEVWKGLLQLSCLPYWSRRWIVQEVLLAREVTMLLDDQEPPWIALELPFGLLN